MGVVSTTLLCVMFTSHWENFPSLAVPNLTQHSHSTHPDRPPPPDTERSTHPCSALVDALVALVGLVLEAEAAAGCRSAFSSGGGGGCLSTFSSGGGGGGWRGDTAQGQVMFSALVRPVIGVSGTRGRHTEMDDAGGHTRLDKTGEGWAEQPPNTPSSLTAVQQPSLKKLRGCVCPYSFPSPVGCHGACQQHLTWQI